MERNFDTLDFSSILTMLQSYALSDQAKRTVAELTPYLNEDVCNHRMAETTAARRVLDACGSPPLAAMKSMDEALAQASIGAMLLPAQLTDVALFAASCKRMTAYLLRSESHAAEIAAYGRVLHNLAALQTELERCVNEETVFDDASSLLRNTRRKKEHLVGSIKEKLNHVLQTRKAYLADSYITLRNGHYVVPVQKRFQSQFGGTVIDASGKGGTVFMEPASVTALQAEHEQLTIAEDAEVRRVLYTLTAMVAEYADAIRRNMDTMESLDVLFAKAKLSAAMKANPVQVGGQRRLCIRKGRHPLLDSATAVPLDLDMDEATSGVIITGPNTGGKTVALKTAGLLSVMAQSGLHIPAAEGSYIAMQDGYWCDIGDSQNISQNLSTFSGHITNVIHILDHASRDSLVLLDELGSGTDPAEGMGIAIAVLEELRLRGCMFLVTTHYPQVKTYAETAERVQSARMAFDPETLSPLYRLEMGKSGESCALHIAKRLGLAPHMVARAHQAVYGSGAESPSDQAAMPAPRSRLQRTVLRKESHDPSGKFAMGDSVIVLPSRETGIVYRPADAEGNVIVQVKGEKHCLRHTRLILQIPASELYPPDYDFSVVFDTVANRKASHILGKRYDADAVIVHSEGTKLDEER